MSDVNSILHGLGIPDENQSDSQPNPENNQDDSLFLSSDELDQILQNNGVYFTETDHQNISPNELEAQEQEQENLNSQEESPAREEENVEEEVSAEASIPLNSPTLLVEETTTRFSGAEWYNEIQKARIIIAGVGGIGSNVAFQLARMSPANITLYDDDNVELVNMAGQLYRYNDVGRSKVGAIANMILEYTCMNHVSAIKQRFMSDTEPGDIMICGFDNMVARNTFFHSWKRHVMNKPTEEEKAHCLFIDGRLSMTDLQILCIRGDDTYNINRYMDEFLFSDAEADATVCSMKQTTYLACMIGSLIVNLFTNFIANSLDPIIPYDLPFFTEYNAQSMIFKTES